MRALEIRLSRGGANIHGKPVELSLHRPTKNYKEEK